VEGTQEARPDRLFGAVVGVVGSRFSSSASLNLVILGGKSGMTGKPKTVF
jgi:hypothetical protein